MGGQLYTANLLLFLLFVHFSISADISLDAICGNNLVDSCPKKISLKVIGGTSSCAEKVPWNVLVEHATSTNRAVGGGVFPYCGGVLVTDQHVVSAAHCYWTNENQFGSCPDRFLEYSHSDCVREGGCPASCSRLGPPDLLLYLGLTRRTTATKADGRKVSSIAIHPGWDRTKKLNDILAGHDLAVLKMVNKVNMYSRTTVPICLPSPRDSYLLQEGSFADISVHSRRRGRWPTEPSSNFMNLYIVRKIKLTGALMLARQNGSVMVSAMPHATMKNVDSMEMTVDRALHGALKYGLVMVSVMSTATTKNAISMKVTVK